MKITCIFGSGISKPSGMPMSEELTATILNQSWYRATNDLFYRDASAASIDGVDIGRRAREFLNYLNERCVSYWEGRTRSKPNYEDLFTLAERIESEAAGHTTDVGFAPFVEQVLKDTKNIWGNFSSGPYCENTPPTNLASVAAYSQTLIQSVIRSMLGIDLRPIGLGALVNLCKDSRISETNIVTLNHDLLVEKSLQEESIQYFDGFSDNIVGTRYFSSGGFEKSHRVTLLKPHGSLDWYRVRLKDSSGSEIERYASLAPKSDPWFLNNLDGTELHADTHSPLFLTGNDKPLSYLGGIHGIQMRLFQNLLDRSRLIICSGYGWKDDGINHLIADWLSLTGNQRLVVLHEGSSTSKTFMPLNIRQWGSPLLRKNRKMVFVDKWLCDTKAEDIISYLQ